MGGGVRVATGLWLSILIVDRLSGDLDKGYVVWTFHRTEPLGYVERIWIKMNALVNGLGLVVHEELC